MSDATEHDHGSEPPEWESMKDLAVGEILAKARKYYNLSLTDVEAALRIRASQLSALERSDFDQLPGRVYAIGFVRAYAEYLGLDGDRMVHLYKVQAGGGAKRPTFHVPAPASESKLPSILTLIISLVAISAIVFAFMIISAEKKGSKVIPAPTEQAGGTVNYIQKTPLEYVLEESFRQLAGQEPISGLLKPRGRIVIRATGTAWLEIRNNQKEILVSRIFQEGDTYLVPDEPGIEMDTGNIGGLEVLVDGAEILPLGEPNEVRRGIRLEVEYLTSAKQE